MPQATAVTLSDAFDPRKNSLAFLRYAFAALVVFNHSFPLGFKLPDPFQVYTHGAETLGGVAVTSFFVLSGFLITASYEKSASTWRFLWHRFLRIYPGYLVCILLGGLALAPLAARLETGSFLAPFHGSPVWPLEYVRQNFFLTVHLFGVPGTLNTVPYPGALNGSLWTLIYEVRCYLGVAVLGAVGLFRGQRFVVLGLFLALWGLGILQAAVPGSAAKALPYLSDPQALRLFQFFLAGASAWLYRDHIHCDGRMFALALGLWMLGAAQGFYDMVSPIALPYAVLWLACRIPIHRFDRFGDFSYGLYVYAFPSQQLLSAAHVNRWGFLPYFAASLGVSTLLAVLSYHLVEKPFLRLKNWKPPLPERLSRMMRLGPTP